MKYEFKTDKNKCRLYVTLTVNTRVRLREAAFSIHTPQVIEHVIENYKPPLNYQLGACISNKLMYVDNIEKPHSSKTWVFELKKKSTKSSRAKK